MWFSAPTGAAPDRRHVPRPVRRIRDRPRRDLERVRVDRRGPCLSLARKRHPVLGSTPLLPPAGPPPGPQFVGDHPFFYGCRAALSFVPGASHGRLDRRDGRYCPVRQFFPVAGPHSPAPRQPLAPFTVLGPGPEGRRITRKIPSIWPSFAPRTLCQVLTSRNTASSTSITRISASSSRRSGGAASPSCCPRATQRRGIPIPSRAYLPGPRR